MKRIKLVNSKKYFTVSDIDYSRVILYDWSLEWQFGQPFSSARIYTVTSGKKIYLSRFILGETDSKVIIDHYDRNPLNNDRSNLRPCTRTENRRNNSKQQNCSSKYKGVIWYAKDKRWSGQIRVNKKLIFLGFFDTEIEAAKTYDTAAKNYFGEFASQNFSASKTDK